MNKQIDFKDLVDSGQLKRESGAGADQVNRLISRAKKDLVSAQKLLESDQAAAMDLVYKAYFHAANALLRRNGLRPGPVRQHLGVLTATERLLGKDQSAFIATFDRLRKRRNEFEYQGIFEMGATDLKLAFDAASEFVRLVDQQLTRAG